MSTTSHQRPDKPEATGPTDQPHALSATARADDGPERTHSSAVDRQSPLWSMTAKAIVAITVLVLSGLIVWRFQDLLRPIVYAAILAYLVNPLIGWLMARLNLGRGRATVIVYLTLLVFVVVGAGVLSFVAFDQLGRLANLLPNTMGEFVDLTQAQFDALLLRLSARVGYDLSTLEQGVDLRATVEQAVTLLQGTLRQGGSLVASVATGTFSTLTNGILIFFISLYLAKDSPQFFRSISNAAHESGYRRDAERLMRDFVRIWDAYLRGQIILGLVIGTVVSLGLGALGVNNALGLGILSGLLEFLPIIGPLIGTAAAVLVALFQPENYWGLDPLYLALAVLVLMVIIQQVENNVLVPRIVGDALDLHPVVIMVGVLMGASLAGILGAVLAAPVVATIKLLGGYIWRKLLDLPPFPEPEPPPKPKRGQMGWGARWRLLRLRLAQGWQRRA